MMTGGEIGMALGVVLFEVTQTVFAWMPEEAAAHTLAVEMLVPVFHSAFLVVGVVCCTRVLSLAAMDRQSDTHAKT